MYIERALQPIVEKALVPGKVIRVYGPRRVGKTVLVKHILEEWKGKTELWNGDDMNVRKLLENRSAENYRSLTQGLDLLVIDEAQGIPNIGPTLKLMVDEIPELKILVTGSSSFVMQQVTGEPLVGRAYTYTMFPISQIELSATETKLETMNAQQQRMLYGSYPEVLGLTLVKEKKQYLTELVNSALLKDVLQLDGVRNTSKVLDLLRLVAYQIGNEVSLQELGTQLGMSKNTVEKYLDILEQAFIVKRFRGYSKNMRSEVVKSNKWYFTDVGIRNAIIRNFNDVSVRNDVGELWENYVIMERIKHTIYKGFETDWYFWRTYQQQELDCVEVHNDLVRGYEIKYAESAKVKIPKQWKEFYPEAEVVTITRSNYLDWITK